LPTELVKHQGAPDYEGQNTAELICLNCGDKFGWHHGKNPDGTMTKCYGISCTCDGFYHNLCCLTPIIEKALEKLI